MVDTGFHITVYDELAAPLGFADDYLSCLVTRVWNGVGTGTLTIGEHHPLAGQFLACNTLTAVPIRVEGHDRLWTGRVTHADLAGPVGAGTVTATMKDDWSWFREMLAWPDPTADLQHQPVSADQTNQPLETACKAYISANAKRLRIPMFVVPPPVVDTSPLVSLSARFTPIDELVTVPLTTHNRTLTIFLWQPGDDQPPGLPAGQVLTVPILVVDITSPADNAEVTFSELEGAVTSRSVSVTAPTAVTAVAAGPGSLTQRLFTAYTDPNTTSNLGPFAAREVLVAASEVTTVDAALAKAKAVFGQTNIGTASVNVVVQDGQPFTYGTDYLLGDVVGVTVRDVESRDRVTQVTESDDQNGFVVTPVVGNPQGGESTNVVILRTLAALAARLTTENART
jgi:hypothetical protein